jgi:hypothetical protein
MEGAFDMADALFVVIGLVFFVALWWFTRACDGL